MIPSPCRMTFSGWIALLFQRIGVVFLCAVLGAAGHAESADGTVTRIETGDMSFSVCLETGALSAFRYFGQPAPGVGGVRFEDGRRNEPLTPTGEQGARPDEIHTVAFGFREDANLAGTIEVRTNHGYVSKTIELRNDGAEQKWVEMVLALPAPTAAEYMYYDGLETHDGPGGREALVGTFPLAAVYAEDGAGLALGIEPNQLLSYLRNECGETAEGPALSYANRMVIDPGESERVEFVFFPFHARYGHLDAIQVYQDFFPEAFHPQPGVDPRIKKTTVWWTWAINHALQDGAGLNRAHPEGTDDYKVYEMARKYNMGMEWCWIGYGYRPGDWLCTEDLTGDWSMRHDDGILFRKKYRSAEEQMKLHHDAYARTHDFDIAPMMYIIPSYCEEDLADHLYPDSIYYDPHGNPRTAGPPWAARESRCYQMYPYGNSFGEYTLKAIEKIVERTDISGFAFDCIDRARYDYYGPGAERSPGRAYHPERGVYANSETAHAMFNRHVHTLSRGDLRMAVVGNGRASSGSYLSMFTMDANIIEHPPWDERPLPAQVRLLSGKKSLTWWEGFRHLLRSIRGRPPEEAIRRVRHMIDYSVLRALHLGIYLPPRFMQGSEKIFYYAPIMTDLFARHGWEPVPAFRADPELWTSRYGRGVGASLVLGNPTLDPIETETRIDTPYFGEGTFLFVDYEGRIDVLNRVANDQTVLSPLTVPGAEAIILRAVAEVRGQPVTAAQGRIIHAPGRPGKLALRIRAESAGPRAFRLFVPEGMRPGELRVNGEPVSHGPSGPEAEADVTLEAGMNDLVLSYHPIIEAEEADSVLAFPFLTDEEEANCTIVLPARETGRDALMGRRIANFFDTAVYGTHDADEKVNIPVKRSERPGAIEGNTVVLSLSDELGTRRGVIRREGDVLHVLGADEEALEETVLLLLGLLDDVYPFYGYALAWTSRRAEFQEMTGMDYIPWERP